MTRASSSQPATILVVDDSDVVLTVTKSVLEAAGYRVLTHPGPTGCVAVILQEKPDLVLIDVNMPKLGGETIVKLFGKAQPNSETIILLFSTLPADQLEYRAQTSGAHGYIRKTEDTFELQRQVNRWLKPKEFGTISRTGSGEIRVVRAGAGPQSGERPRLAADAKAAAEADERRSSAKMEAARMPTILFVDDDMTALSHYRRDVQGEPYRTEFALSTQQALRHLHSDKRPDVLVASLEPAGMEIFGHAVRSDRSWQKRVILVTSAGRSARATEFLETFPGIVLRRPVDGRELCEAVRRALAASDGATDRRSGGTKP